MRTTNRKSYSYTKNSLIKFPRLNAHSLACKPSDITSELSLESLYLKSNFPFLFTFISVGFLKLSNSLKP
jgi:hypothetical protein